MDKKPSSKFKMSFDDDRPESLLEARRESLRVDSLAKRLVAVTIILILLFSAAFAAGYFVIIQKFDRVYSHGSREVQEQTKKLEDKFASLSLQYQKLETLINSLELSFSKKVSPMDEIFVSFERTTASLKDTLKSTQRSIEDLKNAKVDKAEMTAAVGDVMSSLGSVREDIDAMDADIKKTVQNVDKKMDDVRQLTKTLQIQLKSTEDEIKSIKTQIDKKNADQISREILDQKLKEQEKQFAGLLEKELKTLKEKDREIKTLENKIASLEKQYESMQAMIRRSGSAAPVKHKPRPQNATREKKTPEKPEVVRPKTEPQTPDKKEQTEPAIPKIPKPGEVIEQDL